MIQQKLPAHIFRCLTDGGNVSFSLSCFSLTIELLYLCTARNLHSPSSGLLPSQECRRKPFRSNFLGPPPRRRVLVYDEKDIYKRSGRTGAGVSSRSRVGAKTKNVDKKRPLLKEAKTKKDKRKLQTGSCQDSVDSKAVVNMSSGSKKTKKRKKTAHNEETECIIDSSEKSLIELERSVNEKLYKQISLQLHSGRLSVTESFDKYCNVFGRHSFWSSGVRFCSVRLPCCFVLL